MATEEQGSGIAFERVKTTIGGSDVIALEDSKPIESSVIRDRATMGVDEKYWVSGKFQGLTFDEITVACRNVGINLECRGCAENFYTGKRASPHDEDCTLNKPDEDLGCDPDTKQTIFDLLQESRKQFPTLKTHVATVIVEAGPARVTYSVSISRGEV